MTSDQGAWFPCGYCVERLSCSPAQAFGGAALEALVVPCRNLMHVHADSPLASFRACVVFYFIANSQGTVSSSLASSVSAKRQGA